MMALLTISDVRILKKYDTLDFYNFYSVDARLPYKETIKSQAFFISLLVFPNPAALPLKYVQYISLHFCKQLEITMYSESQKMKCLIITYFLSLIPNTNDSS